MSRGHDHARSKQIKRHALLRDIDVGRPLWAGNDADWKMILEHRGAVICDRPGCRGQLVPNDCDEVNRRRHMSYPKGSGGGCGHHDGALEEPAEADRGMSERHRWMQNYITDTCRRLKYSAIPEYELTGPGGDRVARADVWVEPARIAVEVQQRGTDFQERTAARVNGGAVQTIWLLSHDANDASCGRALFSLPAVRFMVVDRRLPWRERELVEFEPWLDSAALDEFAGVSVWATTWQLMSERPYLRTCKLELQQFLSQVLQGRRVWVSGDPAMPRLESGSPKVGWVLLDDLEEVRSRIADDEAAQAPAAAAAAVSVKPELPEPDVSDSAARDQSQSPADLPAPVPCPPAPPLRAAPARVSVPAVAGSRPGRVAVPPPQGGADWEQVAALVAMVVLAIVVVAFLWAAYHIVSGVVDGIDAWWTSLTHVPVPAVRHCGAFCRS